ncbi:MAG: Na+:solute symporter [Nitrospirae bacterium]|nr:Na+:solute symporter [Nitrospirota bacterium]
MTLTILDWSIIAAFMAASIAIGVLYTKKASSSTDEFFLSGRNMPWWLAGTSMVATTFSSDTPLYITALIRTKGIYENWQWWCFLLSGMLSVFFFARLWRRAGVVTDVELTEMRYSGPEAAALRGFRALYFSVAIHTIIKAQVILAMAKIMDVFFGMGKWEAVLISSSVTIFYSMLSGFWGVILTDFMQFIVAMAGAIVLAWIAVDSVGGLGGIEGRIAEMYPASNYTDFFPPMGGEMFGPAALTFIAYMGMSWWSKYSSDGGGVVVQRMASCKDERNALLGTLFFNIANYAVRSWPWILTGLASLLLYPVVAGEDPEVVYPRMVVDLMSPGMKGLMVASFFAAFMSTISTYLNLSSAYFVNDFYRRFVKKDETERHYVNAGRWATLVLSAVTAYVAYQATSIVGIFKFLIAFGSGTGLVYLVRWYWWRVNAWSEISAMLASTVVSIVLYTNPAFTDMPFYERLYLIISISTCIWVVVTLLTKPTDEAKLIEFYKRAAPGGPGWKHIESKITDPHQRGKSIAGDVIHFFLGTVMVYGYTLGVGKLLLGHAPEGVFYLLAAIVSTVLLYTGLTKRGWGRVYE